MDLSQQGERLQAVNRTRAMGYCQLLLPAEEGPSPGLGVIPVTASQTRTWLWPAQSGELPKFQQKTAKMQSHRLC